MATKYIEADKVEKITWEKPSYYDPLNVLTEVRDKVRALPAADVIPVDYVNECIHICELIPASTCASVLRFLLKCYKTECGAKMDGEENG